MSASSNPTDSGSYSEMSVADVEAIGAHCQMTFCRQLDFLPFRCESCRGKFCLDHRTETAHACPRAGEWSQRREQEGGLTTKYDPPRKPSVLTHEQQCAETTCKTLVDTPLVTGVHCLDCNRRYCLKHRFREDHDCGRLPPIAATRSQMEVQKEKGLAALGKLRAWGAAKKSSIVVPQTRSRAAAAGATKAAADLRRTAKGDEKVPQDKRIYLHVEAEKATLSAKIEGGRFFYNKEWSVGRVLDMAAKTLQVENVNNRGGGELEKLRVYHVEGGRLLEFAEKLGAVVQTGNTIVLLRGAGPAVPDLIRL